MLSSKYHGYLSDSAPLQIVKDILIIIILPHLTLLLHRAGRECMVVAASLARASRPSTRLPSALHGGFGGGWCAALSSCLSPPRYPPMPLHVFFLSLRRPSYILFTEPSEQPHYISAVWQLKRGIYSVRLYKNPNDLAI